MLQDRSYLWLVAKTLTVARRASEDVPRKTRSLAGASGYCVEVSLRQVFCDEPYVKIELQHYSQITPLVFCVRLLG
jgi:hypothetical protein